MDHLENNSILNERQHAFRKNHSCESQLINVIHDWATSIDQCKQTDIFILDFEKAFDTVPHELIKSKLHQAGVNKNILLWIDSFLSNRQQCVVVNGTKSNNEAVKSGVPQSTVLGPVLFLLHINDITENVSSETRLFADDCVCYREIKDINDCIILQNDINKLGEWAEKSGMRFQPTKCNIMRLSRKKNNIDFKYKLKGTELEQLDSIKYLGVNIASNLHWAKHIDEICNKAYKILGLLKRNLSSCPQEVKMLAYKGLIRPILEYASAVWDPHQKFLQEKLEKVQNQAARFIASNYSQEPGSMTKILLDLKLEPLKERRKKSRLILFCKALHHRAAIPTGMLQRPKRQTRNMHSEHFINLHSRTDTLKASFIPNTVKEWNLLPSEVIEKSKAARSPVESFAAIVKGGGGVHVLAASS